MYIDGKRYEWHPAIRALGWVSGWGMVAVSAAVLVEFLVSRRGLPSHPARVAARAAVIGTGIVLAAPLLPVMETWWRLVQHARRQGDGRATRPLVAILTAGALVVAGVWALLPVWLLPRMWRGLASWAATIDPLEIGNRPKAGMGWTIVLLAGCVVLARFSALAVYFSVRNYAACIRTLGFRRVLRGVAMMAFLRLRQPRREFFRLAPVIADVFPFAFIVGVYTILPASVLAAGLAWMLAATQAAMSLDRVRPPTWLFLGTSDYEAFWVFSDLRHNWGPTAVALLDRTSTHGYDFYAAEREMWSREHRMSRGLFYDPTQPRVWDLRTRPNLWQHTVVLLIDYVPLVVVDLRRPSELVADEVKWLADPSRIGKALFLVGEEGLLPQYDELLPQSARHRVLTGPALYAYAGRPAADASSPSPHRRC